MTISHSCLRGPLHSTTAPLLTGKHKAECRIRPLGQVPAARRAQRRCWGCFVTDGEQGRRC